LDEWIKQNYQIVIYILGGAVVLLSSLLTFFLKTDRKRFMEKDEELKKDVQNLSSDLKSDMKILNKEVDDVKSNYNKKFDGVNANIKDIDRLLTDNHLVLLNAIHEVDIKVARLQPREQ